MSDRYGPSAPRASRPEAEWHADARRVLLDMVDRLHAVTVSEIEARAADRAWNPEICRTGINPHHLTNARNELAGGGDLVETSAATRSHAAPITTWSRRPVRGLGRKIEDAAGRKRLLAARHNGWSERGGAGRGLIGRAGENALDAALRSTESPVTAVTGSTTVVLGVGLRTWGEIDNSALYVDTSNPAQPTVVTCMFEVKNTRSWYYADDGNVKLFLAKAAVVQASRPDQLVLPVFVCRRFQYTLWEQGERYGFLPVKVEQQLVLPDYELTPESFNEVRVELGFVDMVLGDRPTNRHLGLVHKALPRYALSRASLWQRRYAHFLPASFLF